MLMMNVVRLVWMDFKIGTAFGKWMLLVKNLLLIVQLLINIYKKESTTLIFFTMLMRAEERYHNGFP